MKLNFFLFAEMICWQQTLFALPWLLCAILLLPLTGYPLVLSFGKATAIFLAFFIGRSAAMTFNRYLDREIDRANERTKHRAIPAGRISPNRARAWACGALLCYWLACFTLNERCFYWAVCTSPLLIGYSFFKRFSWTCHLVLGVTQAILPIMVSLALLEQITPQHVLLGLTLGFNVSAFDILYSLQDQKCDQRLGLFSLPATFGVQAALNWSRALHGASVATLLYLGVLLQFPWPFFALSMLFVAGLLIGHMWLVKKRGGELLFFSWGNSAAGFIVLTAMLGTLFWEIL